MKRIFIILLTSSIIMSCSTSKKLTKSNVPPVDNNNFEGWVKYKTTPVKPDIVPQDVWEEQLQEMLGDRGYIIYKNYYKPGQFSSYIDAGFESGKEVYNPADRLHYTWQLESDSAKTQNHFEESLITITQIIELDTTATINGIPCNALRVNMNIGYYIYWYNPNYLKVKVEDYKGSLFDRQVIAKVGCLPIKNEIEGMLLIELQDYKAEKVSDGVFKIPKFVDVSKMGQY